MNKVRTKADSYYLSSFHKNILTETKLKYVLTCFKYFRDTKPYTSSQAVWSWNRRRRRSSSPESFCQGGRQSWRQTTGRGACKVFKEGLLTFDIWFSSPCQCQVCLRPQYGHWWIKAGDLWCTFHSFSCYSSNSLSWHLQRVWCYQHCVNGLRQRGIPDSIQAILI